MTRIGFEKRKEIILDEILSCRKYDTGGLEFRVSLFDYFEMKVKSSINQSDFQSAGMVYHVLFDYSPNVYPDHSPGLLSRKVGHFIFGTYSESSEFLRRIYEFYQLDVTQEKICISIHALRSIDFKKIDSRIEHDGAWQECYPMRAKISIPKAYEAELLAILKANSNITLVNGEPTGHGDDWTRSIGYGR